MKKIVISAGSLVVMYALLSSTAAAMFLPSAEFTGINLQTASYGIQVSSDAQDPVFQDTATLLGSFDLQPDMTPFENIFWVKSDNSQGQRISLSARIEGGSGDWEQLKDLVKIQIQEATSGESSDWLTLQEWQTAQTMPVPTMAESVQRQYKVLYDFSSTYSVDPDGEGPLSVGDQVGNETMGLSLEGVKLIIEGTPINI